MVRILLLIVAGLISAPLMEVLSVIWFRTLPAGIDLTANYFLSVVLPMALILHFIMALLLWKVFEPDPKRYCTIYVGTHVLTEAAMLTILGNPMADVALFCLTVIASGALVMTVFSRYFWCPACAAPPEA
ncbi:MAG: hypothetical protein ACC642_10265 [Pseudomonadales bacterium]